MPEPDNDDTATETGHGTLSVEDLPWLYCADWIDAENAEVHAFTCAVQEKEFFAWMLNLTN